MLHPLSLTRETVTRIYGGHGVAIYDPRNERHECEENAYVTRERYARQHLISA